MFNVLVLVGFCDATGSPWPLVGVYLGRSFCRLIWFIKKYFETLSTQLSTVLEWKASVCLQPQVTFTFAVFVYH